MANTRLPKSIDGIYDERLIFADRDAETSRLEPPRSRILHLGASLGLHRRWLYAACAGVFCFGLVSIAMAIEEDRFIAQAHIVAQSTSQSFDPVLTDTLTDRVLRHVVEAEHLSTDPEFAPRPWTSIACIGMIFGWIDPLGLLDHDRDQAVLALQKAITLKAVRQARRSDGDDVKSLSQATLEIDVASHDAEKAARIANSVAGAIIDEDRRRRDEKTARNQAIANEVAQFATQLRMATQNLANARQAQDLKNAVDQTGAIGGEDQTISLAGAKADVDSISRAMASGRASRLTNLHFATPDLDRLLAQYADLQQQYQKRKLTLGDKHPDLLALDEEIRGMQKDIHSQWQKTAEIANRNYRSAQARAAASKGTSAADPSLGLAEAAQDKLQADVDLARRDYDRALQLQTDSASADQPVLSLSPAAKPLSAAHKPQGFIIGAAMMLGAMFGAGRTLTGGRRASVKSPVKPTSTSARILPIPRIKTGWLAETLRMTPRLDAACCEVLDQPQSDFSRSMARLLDHTMDVASRGAVKILFVSNQDGLGGTTVAVNFAQMAAQAGYRVLLMEANRRHPILASLISPNVDVDLIELSGQRRIVCHLRPGLSALPLFDDKTSDMLETRADHCLKGINSHFDLVVIDGGTYDPDDKETIDLVDAVNRVFQLNPEGIDLEGIDSEGIDPQAGRKSIAPGSLGRRR